MQYFVFWLYLFIVCGFDICNVRDRVKGRKHAVHFRDMYACTNICEANAGGDRFIRRVSGHRINGIAISSTGKIGLNSTR